MQPPSTSTIVLIALLPMIGWRVYARFRRTVGRQPILRVVLLALPGAVAAQPWQPSRPHKLFGEMVSGKTAQRSRLTGSARPTRAQALVR